MSTNETSPVREEIVSSVPLVAPTTARRKPPPQSAATGVTLDTTTTTTKKNKEKKIVILPIELQKFSGSDMTKFHLINVVNPILEPQHLDTNFKLSTTSLLILEKYST
jgi:hypothetical protein